MDWSLSKKSRECKCFTIKWLVDKRHCYYCFNLNVFIYLFKQCSKETLIFEICVFGAKINWNIMKYMKKYIEIKIYNKNKNIMNGRI